MNIFTSGLRFARSTGENLVRIRCEYLSRRTRTLTPPWRSISAVSHMICVSRNNYSRKRSYNKCTSTLVRNLTSRLIYNLFPHSTKIKDRHGRPAGSPLRSFTMNSFDRSTICLLILLPPFIRLRADILHAHFSTTWANPLAFFMVAAFLFLHFATTA